MYHGVNAGISELGLCSFARLFFFLLTRLRVINDVRCSLTELKSLVLEGSSMTEGGAVKDIALMFRVCFGFEISGGILASY